MTNFLLDLPRKKERTQKIINERGKITTNITEIQKIGRDNYEQLYTNKLDNLDKMDKFKNIKSIKTKL